MDLPSLSHSANVNGFMVEPGWKPPMPLRSLPSLSMVHVEVQLRIEPLAGQERGVLGHRDDLAGARLDGDQRGAPLVRVGAGGGVDLVLGGRLRLRSSVVVMVRPPP